MMRLATTLCAVLAAGAAQAATVAATASVLARGGSAPDMVSDSVNAAAGATVVDLAESLTTVPGLTAEVRATASLPRRRVRIYGAATVRDAPTAVFGAFSQTARWDDVWTVTAPAGLYPDGAAATLGWRLEGSILRDGADVEARVTPWLGFGAAPSALDVFDAAGPYVRAGAVTATLLPPGAALADAQSFALDVALRLTALSETPTAEDAQVVTDFGGSLSVVSLTLTPGLSAATASGFAPVPRIPAPAALPLLAGALGFGAALARRRR